MGTKKKDAKQHEIGMPGLIETSPIPTPTTRLNPASRTPMGKFATDHMSFVRRGKQKAGTTTAAKNGGADTPNWLIRKPEATSYPAGGLSGMAAIGVGQKAESVAPQAFPSQVRVVQKPRKGRERQGAFGALPRRTGTETPPPFGPIAALDPDKIRMKVGWTEEARAAALAARRALGQRPPNAGDQDKIREAALRAHANKLQRLGSLDHHSYRIAADTLRMPKPIADVMGGPSQDGARAMADQLLAGKFAAARVVPTNIGKEIRPLTKVAGSEVPSGFKPGRNPTSGIAIGASMDLTRGTYPYNVRAGQSFGMPGMRTAAENTARMFDGIWDSARVKTRGPIGRGAI